MYLSGGPLPAPLTHHGAAARSSQGTWTGNLWSVRVQDSGSASAGTDHAPHCFPPPTRGGSHRPGGPETTAKPAPCRHRPAAHCWPGTCPHGLSLEARDSVSTPGLCEPCPRHRACNSPGLPQTAVTCTPPSKELRPEGPPCAGSQDGLPVLFSTRASTQPCAKAGTTDLAKPCRHPAQACQPEHAPGPGGTSALAGAGDLPRQR